MPSFDVQISGGDQVVWKDQHTPTRLNPNPAHPHTYRAVALPGTIIVEAVVDGVVAPLDTDPVMAGRVFTATIARWSGSFPPIVTQATGQSSVIGVALGADNIGHHQLLVTLSDDGGSIGIPFDGE